MALKKNDDNGLTISKEEAMALKKNNSNLTVSKDEAEELRNAPGEEALLMPEVNKLSVDEEDRELYLEFTNDDPNSEFYGKKMFLVKMNPRNLKFVPGGERRDPNRPPNHPYRDLSDKVEFLKEWCRSKSSRDVKSVMKTEHGHVWYEREASKPEANIRGHWQILPDCSGVFAEEEDALFFAQNWNSRAPILTEEIQSLDEVRQKFGEVVYRRAMNKAKNAGQIYD